MRSIPLRNDHRHRVPFALFIVLGVVSGFVQPMAAEAVDLTGTWKGKAVCKGLLKGFKTADTYEQPLLITQSGSDLKMEFLGVAYNGAVQDEAAAPAQKGQGTFVACSTTTDYSTIAYSEIGSFSAKLNLTKDASSTFKATSVFYTESSNFQSCKWTFRRADPTDPNRPGC